MQQKLFQITDNVHGTIYYTDLENSIIHTPYFNRLHDVNQSSTVYLTFPTNRTKRYEHSLGVMQLTSDIFANAFVNSVGTDAIKFLLKQTEEEFKSVVESLKPSAGLTFTLKNKGDRILSHFSRNKYDHTKAKLMIEKHFKDSFSDNCLMHLSPNNLEPFESFLFLTLLQALRLVGLLHDCGHPPQSHIVESVLMEIKDELDRKKSLNACEKEFIDILGTYTDRDNPCITKIDQQMIIKTQDSSRIIKPLHEMIGMQIAYRILSRIIPDTIEEKVDDAAIVNDEKRDKSTVLMLFYCLIYEFFFAIIRNKNDFWSSLHSIVDGTLDADQLDYVARDSKNSGMMWGSIPYTRLINTLKLAISPKNNMLVIAFSNKNIDLMDEILQNRYKVYSTINYHHRCAKIARLFKATIKMLAMRYLSTSDENEDCTGYYFNYISGLWKAITVTFTNYDSEMNIVQWNDSWLNGILYQELTDQTTFKLSDKQDDGAQKLCIKCLEEIYTSKKNYFSLIKRTSQLMEIYDAYAIELENNVIRRVKDEIESVTHDIEESDENDSEEIISKKEGRQFLINALKQINDCGLKLDLLQRKLGNENLFYDAIETVLKKHSDKISSYFIEQVHFGLANEDLVVYDDDMQLKSYHSYSCIKQVIFEFRVHFPYYYIYLSTESSSKLSEEYLAELRREIGRSMANGIFELLCNHVTFEHI